MDRVVEVVQRPVVLLAGVPQSAPVDVPAGVIGLEADGLVVVLQGAVVVALLLPGHAPAGEGICVALVVAEPAGEILDGLVGQGRLALLQPAGYAAVADPDPAALLRLHEVDQVGQRGDLLLLGRVVALAELDRGPLGDDPPVHPGASVGGLPRRGRDQARAGHQQQEENTSHGSELTRRLARLMPISEGPPWR